MDIYRLSEHPRYVNRPNFWTKTEQGVAASESGDICSTRGASNDTVSIANYSLAFVDATGPASFWEAMTRWGSPWMWNNMKMLGGVTWLEEAIAAGTCCAVTDGSYMKEVFPDINAAAFVLECTQDRGRLWGSFVEQTADACSYRGKLLGLMAIHLILLAVNECNRNLQGSVHIYSDCLGALNKVENLPPAPNPHTVQAL
jgi:hypothetical protein